MFVDYELYSANMIVRSGFSHSISHVEHSVSSILQHGKIDAIVGMSASAAETARMARGSQNADMQSSPVETLSDANVDGDMVLNSANTTTTWQKCDEGAVQVCVQTLSRHFR